MTQQVIKQYIKIKNFAGGRISFQCVCNVNLEDWLLDSTLLNLPYCISSWHVSALIAFINVTSIWLYPVHFSFFFFFDLSFEIWVLVYPVYYCLREGGGVLCPYSSQWWLSCHSRRFTRGIVKFLTELFELEWNSLYILHLLLFASFP